MPVGGWGVLKKESLLKGERGTGKEEDDLAWRVSGASMEAWLQPRLRLMMAFPHLSASCDGCSGACSRVTGNDTTSFPVTKSENKMAASRKASLALVVVVVVVVLLVSALGGLCSALGCTVVHTCYMKKEEILNITIRTCVYNCQQMQYYRSFCRAHMWGSHL